MKQMIINPKIKEKNQNQICPKISQNNHINHRVIHQIILKINTKSL